MGIISLSDLESLFAVLATFVGTAVLVFHALILNRIEILFWEQEKKIKRYIVFSAIIFALFIVVNLFTVYLYFGLINKLLTAWGNGGVNAKKCVKPFVIIALLFLYSMVVVVALLINERNSKKDGEDKWQTNDMISGQILKLGIDFVVNIGLIVPIFDKTNIFDTARNFSVLIVALVSAVVAMWSVLSIYKHETRIQVYFEVGRDKEGEKEGEKKDKYYIYFREGDYMVCGKNKISNFEFDENNSGFRLFPMSELLGKQIEMHFEIDL
jgi:membrane protein